jgi:hypothetical protein
LQKHGAQAAAVEDLEVCLQARSECCSCCSCCGHEALARQSLAAAATADVCIQLQPFKVGSDNCLHASKCDNAAGWALCLVLLLFCLISVLLL